MSFQIDEFLNFIFCLESLRENVDFFAGESNSLLCMDLLLNQRVGVERATSAALAIHHHFGKSKLESQISEVTMWPYEHIELRRSAKSVYKIAKKHITFPNTIVGELPSSAVGALASLERYYNRANEFFSPLREVELSAQTIDSITLDEFKNITELNFPEENLLKQLGSVAKLLEMKSQGKVPLRSELKALDRVGDEAADTFLVYLFNQPAVIVDEYLQRILFRHSIIDKEKLSRKKLVDIISEYVDTREESHRLHSRSNEIGSLHCFAQNPDCENCPLNQFNHIFQKSTKSLFISTIN